MEKMDVALPPPGHDLKIESQSAWNTENSTWSQSSTLSSCTGLLTHCTSTAHPRLKKQSDRPCDNLTISDQFVKPPFS